MTLLRRLKRSFAVMALAMMSLQLLTMGATPVYAATTPTITVVGAPVTVNSGATTPADFTYTITNNTTTPYNISSWWMQISNIKKTGIKTFNYINGATVTPISIPTETCTYSPTTVCRLEIFNLPVNTPSLAVGQTVSFHFQIAFNNVSPTTPETHNIFLGAIQGSMTTFSNNAANFTVNNPIASYTLTYNAGANGTVSGTSPQTVNQGSSGSAVTATPNTGYHFTSWSDGSTQNPRTDTNVQGNISVTANFAINTYTLNYSAGAGGSISGTSPQTVNHGSSGSAVTAVANTGYHFVNWSDSSVQNPRTDTNVTANKSVTANFALSQFTITFNSNGGTPVAAKTQNYGTVVTAPTNPTRTGYSFSGWSPMLPPTMPAYNQTVTAQWSINHYTVAATVVPSGKGTVYGAGTYTYGADVSLTTVPATGYHFSYWSGDCYGNWSTFYIHGLYKNISCTANFSINRYDLDYDSGSHGHISGDRNQEVNYGASGTAATAVPDTGYHFTHWSDGSTQNPRTDTNVQHDIHVTAHFAINTYSLSYLAGAGGTVSGSVSQTVNYGASGTAVTAVPDTGYHFTGWSDGNNSATRTDTHITANLVVTANFEIDTFEVTADVVSDGNGYVLGDGTHNYGDSFDLTAYAYYGYAFSHWEGDCEGTDPTYHVNSLESPLACTAVFAPVDFTVTFDPNEGTLTGPETEDVAYLDLATEPSEPTREGYTFVCWAANDQTEEIDTFALENSTNCWDFENDQVLYDITLAAQWSINSYTITFDSAGGSDVAAITQEYGTSVTTPANPTRPGYTFQGWSEVVPDTMPAGDMLLVAQWQLIPVTPAQQTAAAATTGGGATVASEVAGTTVTNPQTTNNEVRGATEKKTEKQACPWWWIILLLLLATVSGVFYYDYRQLEEPRTWWLWPVGLAAVAFLAHLVLQDDNYTPTVYCNWFWAFDLGLTLLAAAAYSYARSRKLAK